MFLAALAMCLSACLPPPPGSSDAAIFKRPNRYGWGSQGGANAQEEPKPAEPSNSRRGNRFGDTGSSGSGNPNSGSNLNRDSGSGPDDSSGSTPPSNPVDDQPPGGDSADGKKKDMPNTGGSGSNTSSNTPPSNLNSYPYARLVPGKKGFVTLPGSNASIGEIDVTGIKPGTPVEINDPRDASKKIYFRVP